MGEGDRRGVDGGADREGREGWEEREEEGRREEGRREGRKGSCCNSVGGDCYDACSGSTVVVVANYTLYASDPAAPPHPSDRW